MDCGQRDQQGTSKRTGRIKRRLTFSTPVAGIACEGCDDARRASGGTRRPCKNARMNSSPFSFGVTARDVNVTATPTMNMLNVPTSRYRFSFRPRRGVRHTSTQHGASRCGSMQRACQFSGTEAMQQSPAVLCTEMIPAQQVPTEARSGCTASVYQTLFGCPPQFATIPDVVPESQGTAQTNCNTPQEAMNMQATPSSLLAFSALTEKSDIPVWKELPQDHQGMNGSISQGVGSLGAFGSPAEASETPAGAAVEGHVMTSAEALAMNAQAGNLALLSGAFPSLSQLRSPWRDPSNRSSCRSGATSDGLGIDKKFRGTQGDEICPSLPRDDTCQNEIRAQHCMAFGPAFDIRAQQTTNSACIGLRAEEDLIPAAYGPFGASSPLRSGSPFCDSDSGRADSPGFSDMSQDSGCDDDSAAGFSNRSVDLLAATLGDRFETLLLSPDNQVPLLHNSLGRNVSAHGGIAEMHAEPWGQKAVFGSRSTGRVSIASQPGSGNLHGIATIALKLARSGRRIEHGSDEVADVKTPLTVSSSKEDVLFTIGAPLDSKKKPSRIHSLSPAQCTAKLGVCMLEPAPVPQTMMTAYGGDTRSNTAASSPERNGGAISPVSTVTLSLHSIFEQLYANPQDLCDISP